jgi:flagellar biogenesis protein FliO
VSGLALLAVETASPGLAEGELWRSLAAIVVAWAARRGRLSFFTRQPSQVRVEATVPLGDRRSLMVVAIEGRRLLLGLTPVQVSLVTELSTAPFETALAKADAAGASAAGAPLP